ncbi:b(0,+)-type amino acid transporter 1-like isoform X1 [Clavelina lepadiformis]|uniref:b(0,+)-type amino acid transporter 1-like isoform X1 n=1 Tax=Clavelina lepadiformis TaxID=159417 RepID=UPI00404130DD
MRFWTAVGLSNWQATNLIFVMAQPSKKCLLQQDVHLKRDVTLLGGVSVIVGSMIGSGIFISPVGVLKNVGSVGASLVVWMVCGLVAVCGSLTYAELGTMIPKSGAEYPYLKEAFGPIPAFLFAWTSSLVIKPSAVAIIGLVFGEYLIHPFFPDCEPVPLLVIKLASACCISLVCFLNCYSLKIAARAQIVFTTAKLLALFVVIACGIFALTQGLTDNLERGFSGDVHWSTVGTAFYQGLWAYDGWNQLNYVTEELKNPSVNLPRAIMIGIPLVTIVYLLTNIAYLAGLSVTEMMISRAVAVTFGNKFLGAFAWFIPLGVAISTFGGANGYSITGPRIIFSAARHGHMPEILATVSYKRYTPVAAILFQTFIALLVLIPNDFDTLVNYFSFSMWIFHGGSALALLVLRRTQPDRHRPYKVPIFIPILVVLIALYLIIFPIASQPAWEYMYATLFILSGLLFYIPFVHLNLRFTFMKPFTTFVQQLFLVAPLSQYYDIKDT